MTRLSHDALARDIEAVLAFKRALGYPYRRGEAMLRSFQRFADRGVLDTSATFDLATTIEAWLARITQRKPITIATDLAAIRQLCRHRRRQDPTGFVPPRAWAPCTTSRYQPHVFTNDEVRALIAAAGRYEARHIWPAMLRMLLLVAYCTGVRFGEAVRLKSADLDVERRTLFVRESKGRSRLVPFRADLADEFTAYLRQRTLLLGSSRASTIEAVFVTRGGDAITVRAASDAVRRLLRRLRMKGPTGHVGPRPYDLRHTFAVHRLTAWYTEGVDIHAHLPWLSAYMGHVNVLGTEDYLHATPELLQIASDRFAERIRRGSETA